LVLGQEVSPPSAEHVGPGLDRIPVSPWTRRHECRSPAVIAVEPHRHVLPQIMAFGFPDEVDREQRVPISENIGPDVYGLASDPLHREAAIINRRIDILDIDPLGRKTVNRQIFDVHIRANGVMSLEQATPRLGSRFPSSLPGPWGGTDGSKIYFVAWGTKHRIGAWTWNLLQEGLIR